jgi:quinol monooxygenase YgiN
MFGDRIARAEGKETRHMPPSEPELPTNQPTRIDLHLRIRVAPGRRDEFLAFLREAIPFYERPGGIEIRLLQNKTDDHRFIELVLYDDESAYYRDQERVDTDPEMNLFLKSWRSFLAEPPIVEVYRLVKP